MEYIGKWYGHSIVTGNKKREWLNERKNDGTYTIYFKTIDEEGNVEVQIEIGEWGISGDIYFSIFKKGIVDGKSFTGTSTDPYNRDAYKILKLDENEFVYKHIKFKDIFVTKKVSNDFELK